MKRTLVANSARSAAIRSSTSGLDGRVEARRRLVEDEERRVLGKRHRDHDPLLHPPESWCG